MLSDFKSSLNKNENFCVKKFCCSLSESRAVGHERGHGPGQRQSFRIFSMEVRARHGRGDDFASRPSELARAGAHQGCSSTER